MMGTLATCRQRLQALCLHRYPCILICVFLHLIVHKVNGQQAFSTTPVNTTVVEGQDATLNCAVDNLSGTILWSKDNSILGSDRSLPGYNRYSVIGDAASEGNLQVQQAELGDDAEYRCHVSATDETNQNLRSEPAALIVQIAPDAPVFDSYGNGSLISIQPPATVSLVCRANNGKPAATIAWLKDNQPLLYGTPAVTTSPSTDPSGKKINTVSTLTLNPEKEDNGITYQCQVSHPALATPLISGVTLNVQFEPSAPIITGYSGNTIVKAGDPLNLECHSLGGNPLAEVYWYKNDERMDYSYVTDSQGAHNRLPLIVDYSDNNAIYKCQVTSVVLDQPMTTQIQLTVNFPPAYVNITGHESMVRPGTTITLTCTSASSNPPASISWISGGREVKSSDDVVIPAPNGGSITSQALIFTVAADSASVDYSCHATNQELQETTIKTVTVNVMVPPNPPVITGFSGRILKAEELLRLGCRSTRGNPLATLTWYKNGELITGDAVTTTTSGVAANSQLEVILDQTDNGALYACNASNEATPVPLQANVTLDVLFPPSTVSVTVDPPQVKEGNQVAMTCETSSSNPQCTISWLRDGVPFDGPEVGDEVVNDAENGGWSSRRELTLNSVTAANNGGVYLCRAMSDILVESVNDGITLDVRYKPKISTPNGISLSNHEAPGLIILNCTAEGNPAEITHTWKKNGEAIAIDASPRYTLSDTGSLLIHNVTRTEVGEYMCLASNEEGASNITATLDVMYSAKITTGEAITITLDTPGELICEADANPKPPNFITWTRPGFDLSGYTHEYVDGRGIMRIDNVTKAVGGMYTCTADNGIAPADSKNIQVILRYAPEIDRTLPNKIAKSTGQTALLRCRAEGAPNVQFEWFKGSKAVNLTSAQYTLDLRQDLTYANCYESRLIISQIDEIEDYGSYSCRAFNDHGEARFQIELEKTSPPEAPSDLQVVYVSYDKVTLNWTAGFNGGLEQTFQVRFNQKGGKQYQYVDVAPSDATTFTVTNLNPNTEYEFTVRGRNDEGDGPYYLGIVSTRTEVKPTEPPVPKSGRLLVGNIPLYMVLLFSFLCIIACVVCNIFTCCCLVKRKEPLGKRIRIGGKIGDKTAKKKKIKKDEIELVKPIEKEESKETDSDNVSHKTPSDYTDRYSYDNMSYDRRYDDYNDLRAEEYDHYDDQGPLPPIRGVGRGPVAPEYYSSSYRPPSYAASWDSYGNPPSSVVSESQMDDENDREYADMLRRQQQRAHYPGPGGSLYTSSAPSPVPSSLGNFVPLSKGNSNTPSVAGSEEGYLV